MSAALEPFNTESTTSNCFFPLPRRYVWESEETLRGMLGSPEFAETLTDAGFPPVADAEIQILPVHAVLTEG